jgi:hypothetical protein
MYTVCIKACNWRSQWPRGLRRGSAAACLLGSCRNNRCLSLVNSVWCQEEVSAMVRSLVQRSPTECGVIAKPRKWWPRSGIGSKRHRKIKPYILYKVSGVIDYKVTPEFPLLSTISYGVSMENIRFSYLLTPADCSSRRDGINAWLVLIVRLWFVIGTV